MIICRNAALLRTARFPSYLFFYLCCSPRISTSSCLVSVVTTNRTFLWVWAIFGERAVFVFVRLTTVWLLESTYRDRAKVLVWMKESAGWEPVCLRLFPLFTWWRRLCSCPCGFVLAWWFCKWLSSPNHHHTSSCNAASSCGSERMQHCTPQSNPWKQLHQVW